MNKKSFKYLFIILFLNSLTVNYFAQCLNGGCGSQLVPDPDFEILTAATNTTIPGSQVIGITSTPVQDWYGTDPAGGSTPDYTNLFGTTPTGANVYNIACMTGNGQVGVFTKTSGANSREYVQAQLTSPLIANHQYCFSMVVKGRQGAAGNLLSQCDGMGVWFHNMGMINIQTMNGGNQFLGPGSTINANPQVQNPTGNMIGIACQTITGTFCAQGGENYIVIGNFRTDANTTLTGSTSNYMYIDNVSLKESCNTPLNVAVVATPSIICSGVCSTLSVSISGTTSSTSFTWQPGGQTTPTISVCPTSTTTYSLLVNSPGFCLAPQSFSITTTVSVSPSLSVTLTPSSSTVCSGSPVLLTASGGTTYTWSPNASLLSINGASAVATPSSNTTFTVIASNGTCTNSAIANINIASALSLTVNSASVCSGSSAILNATGATNYTWSPSTTLNNANSASVIATPTANTIYTIIGASGMCTGTTTANVSYNTTPTVAVTSGSICSGNSITLVASGAPSYSWSSGETTSSISVSPNSSINYTVTGINNGCINVATSQVTVEPTPTLTVSPDVIIIGGTTTTLSASGTGSTYNWFPPSGLSCTNCISPIASPTITTQYCVSTTLNNCSNTACVLVEVEPPCYSNTDYSTATAFTPNGDGINDSFCLQGWQDCTTSFYITIYNRWGEKVFETDDVTFCWDGTFLGQPLDAAVFVFYIKADIIKVGEVTKKGNITLIK